MTNERGHTQTDDHGKTVNGAGSITEIKLVGFDRPFFTALAITLSIVSILYSFYLGGYLIRTEYWLQRNEAFLEQLSNQGVHVPADLLHKEH